MNLDLRPLTVSEFLDRAFSVYRHRFLLFVALMAPQAVLSLIAALIWGWATASLRSRADFDPANLVGLLIGAGVGGVIFTVVHWVLYVLGVGATAAAVSDLYGHLAPDVGTAFTASSRRLGPLLWLTFLMAVRIAGVLVACSVVPAFFLGAAGILSVVDPARAEPPAVLAVVGFLLLMVAMLVAIAIVIFMGLRYAVAIPAVMLEPIGGREAIRRSVRLTRGLLGRTFLLMICAGVVGYAALMVLQVPFIIGTLVVGPETRAGFWLNMVGIATGSAGQTLTAPIMAIGVAVLYFEARVRHEALDLQVMTAALTPPPPPPAPVPGFGVAPPPVTH
jgi:hypothetical protein